MEPHSLLPHSFRIKEEVNLCHTCVLTSRTPLGDYLDTSCIRSCVSDVHKHIRPGCPFSSGHLQLSCQSPSFFLDGSCLRVCEGVPQGDPLSALLFSSYMAHTLRTVPLPVGTNTRLRAYVDDVVICSPSVELEEDFELVFSHLLGAGLTPNRAKTLLWSTTELDVDIFPGLSQFEQASDGMIVCGHTLTDSMQPEDFPLGSPEFVAQWCMSKIDLERQELSRILALARHPTEISAQCAWHIFKALYPARVLHLLRAMPHEHAIPFVESLADMMTWFLKEFLQFQDIDAPRIRVACLPARVGGLSFPDIQPLALASRIASLSALLALPSPPCIVAMWRDHELPMLLDKLQPSVKCNLKDMVGSLQPLPHSASPGHLTKRIMRAYTSFSRSHLLSELPNTRQVLASRLSLFGLDEHSDSVQHLHCAWMDSVPSQPGCLLPSHCFVWALRDRLAISDGLAGATCHAVHVSTGTMCRETIDRFGRHPLVCSASVRNKRHNALRNLLAMMARGANLHCMCEQKLDVGTEAIIESAEPRPLHSCDLECVSSQLDLLVMLIDNSLLLNGRSLPNME